ncbi:integrase [Palaeococcus sp. (in: euryarchaeotes)]
MIKKAIAAEGNKRNYANALRSFLTFLGEEEILPTELVGIFKQYAKPRKAGVRQVYINDDELREAYKQAKMKGGDVELLFKLLVYSGLRLSQAVRLLNNFDSTKLERINNKVARYPMQEFSRGKKRAFWAYMPLEFALNLQRMSVDYYRAEKITYFGKVSSNTIRKWFYTFLRRNGVPEDVADYIQGRASERIGTKHYLDKTALADEAYSRIVEILKEVVEGKS